MKTETEIKFANINHDIIREKLANIGAKCVQPMRMMKRVVYHNEDMNKKDAFVRIRNEGHRTTITYKQFDDLSIEGAKEIESIIDDFDTMVSIFEKMGLYYDTYQESKRENWEIEDVEIMLDEWPWLNPYIEIESNNINSIKAIVKKLGLEWSDGIYGGAAELYRYQYPGIGDAGIETINHNWPLIKFDADKPDLIK